LRDRGLHIYEQTVCDEKNARDLDKLEQGRNLPYGGAFKWLTPDTFPGLFWLLLPFSGC
jgi:hypothetical protein